MEIEVGKAYRSRLGERVEIVGYYGDSDYPFKDENGRYYTPEGNYWVCGVEYGRDLISEWTDEPAAPKYRAGDLVTVRIDKQRAEVFNAESDTILFICGMEVVKHEPAPFDWKDVKPGMAFKHMAGEDIWIYSGPWIRHEARGIYTTAERRGFFQELGSLCNATDISFFALTRAPEHDIEVAE